MPCHLTKLYAAGEDYLVLGEGVPPDKQQLVTLCDRRRGVGADGCLSFADRSEAFVVHTKEGVATEVSASAVACAAKFLYDRGIVNTTEFCLPHGAAAPRVRIESCGGSAWAVTRDLGFPVLDSTIMPSPVSGLCRAKPMLFGETEVPVTLLAMGRTYAILHLTEHMELSLSSLYATLPSEVVCVGLTRAARDLLSLTVYDEPPRDELSLAAVAATAAAITGDALFSSDIRVACPRATYHVTVTPSLHTYVTTEVEEVYSASITFP